MSLGGLALAIGVLVDASIVMVENAYRHVSEGGAGIVRTRTSQPRDRAGRASRSAAPIFFSLAIIVISFVPVFLLEAQEGRMFRPLAFTKTFAMVAASILSITLVPVLMIALHQGQAAEARVAESDLAVLRVDLRADPPAGAALEMGGAPRELRRGSADGPAALHDRQRVHAAAVRRLAALHADVAARAVDHRATRLLQVQDKMLRTFPEVETRLRHGRPRHDLDRQHADGHGEHDRHAEAARAVARRA